MNFISIIFFVFLCINAIDMIIDYLKFEYNYKLNVETSEEIDFPAISLCTEPNVFFDRTKLVDHFDLSHRFERSR